ncbi:unnamed protein product [Parnassius apollo]|uniref:(apollo) hypothetical protein n=1 Tax=Parnassius apollo TaxID=110799 RepID=A0A8S3W8R3_PARAO|nr:unnamed protein product [Parnassius apollo]
MSPKKSILVIPSRVISRPDNLEGGEETEITAQISVPQEGGWGWVVVAASFMSIFILDGVSFTFGSFLKDMSDDLNVTESLVALLNSIAVALYFIAGPLASAYINRFGFRACVMSGSVICCFSLFASYFTTDYVTLCLFYGAIAGCGYCMINLSSGLIVGFYFEKLRPIAMAIATAGSSIGVMSMFPLNTYLINLSGWRNTTLFHSGLFGLVYFIGMTFRPLLSLTVIKTTDDPTRTVTYLPNLSAAGLRLTASSTKQDNLVPTTTERLFSAVSNYNFPTAAAIVEEGSTSGAQPGPSTAAMSKLTLMANGPQSGINRQQLKQIQDMISKSNVIDQYHGNVNVSENTVSPKKRNFWGRLFHWEEHIPESRPMYRDDAFYDGKLEKLPAYQKSMMETATDPKTGLEYQLAVSRAATTADMQEKRGVFTTAARRVLATMMDPNLLKQKSFLLLCSSAFLIYLGFLVPYVFIQNRNLDAGVDPYHCTLFVSAIGFSNAIGRIVIGAMACKIDPLLIYAGTCIVAGLSTMASDLSYNLYYQYFYCTVFGFCVSSIACLRSMVLVSLYGLEKLTNATGMILLFHGLGSLVSTPVASVIKNKYGYPIAFYAAGFFIALGGFVLLPIKCILTKKSKSIDNRKQTDNK